MKSFSKPTHVLHLINDAKLTSGGAQVIVHNIHNYAKKANLKSTILSFDQLHEANTQKSISTFRFFIILLQALITSDTIFFVHHRLLLLPFLFFRRKRAIFVCHCAYPNKKSFFKLFSHLEFVAVSDATHEYLRNISNKLKIKKIINGISSPFEERRITKPKKTFDIAYIGRLATEKGVLDLALAFLEAASEVSNFRLHIIGEGELQQNLRSLFLSSKIDEKVVFYGYHPHPFSLITNVDLLVVPSHFEGFGLVYYEALDRGHTVLATNLPAFETQSNENHVFHFNVADVEDLRKKLCEIAVRFESIEQQPKLAVRHNIPNMSQMVESYYHFILSHCQ